MKVFISWSGERSKYVAQTLREWLPCVINAIEPWMSEEDIHKGANWPSELLRALENAKFGLICLTPENIDKPWVLYEAGALSNAVGRPGRVCPYLIDLKPSDVKPPLGHLQSTKADREDTLRMMGSINESVQETKEKGLPDKLLSESFDSLWPKLEQRLRSIPAAEKPKKDERSSADLLGEVLETVRALDRKLGRLQTQPLVPGLFPSGTIFGSGGAGVHGFSPLPVFVTSGFPPVEEEQKSKVENEGGRGPDKPKKR